MKCFSGIGKASSIFIYLNYPALFYYGYGLMDTIDFVTTLNFKVTSKNS